MRLNTSMTAPFFSFFLAASTALASSPSTHVREAGEVVYDLQLEYRNPMRDGLLSRNACIEVIRVNRPIMPLVNHVFLIALESPERNKPNAFLFGGSKGKSDMEYFQANMLNRHQMPAHFLSVGYACGQGADRVLEELTRISRKWQNKLRNNLYFIPRMAATPALGRLCNNIAEESILSIGPHLNRDRQETLPFPSCALE